MYFLSLIFLVLSVWATAWPASCVSVVRDGQERMALVGKNRKVCDALIQLGVEAPAQYITDIWQAAAWGRHDTFAEIMSIRLRVEKEQAAVYKNNIEQQRFDAALEFFFLIEEGASCAWLDKLPIPFLTRDQYPVQSTLEFNAWQNRITPTYSITIKRSRLPWHLFNYDSLLKAYPTVQDALGVVQRRWDQWTLLKFSDGGGASMFVTEGTLGKKLTQETGKDKAGNERPIHVDGLGTFMPWMIPNTHWTAGAYHTPDPIENPFHAGNESKLLYLRICGKSLRDYETCYCTTCNDAAEKYKIGNIAQEILVTEGNMPDSVSNLCVEYLGWGVPGMFIRDDFDEFRKQKRPILGVRADRLRLQCACENERERGQLIVQPPVWCSTPTTKLQELYLRREKRWAAHLPHSQREVVDRDEAGQFLVDMSSCLEKWRQGLKVNGDSQHHYHIDLSVGRWDPEIRRRLLCLAVQTFPQIRVTCITSPEQPKHIPALPSVKRKQFISLYKKVAYAGFTVGAAYISYRAAQSLWNKDSR